MNNKLILTIKICLIVCGITFLALSIFTDEKNNTYLIIALLSIVIVNIMNIVDSKKRIKK